MTGTGPFFGVRTILANPRWPITWTRPLWALSEAPRWEGVDKTIIEKTATEAGHPPRTPYINTEQGDLLLLLFLLAGAIGGFIAGYMVRTLFPPKEKNHRAGLRS